MTQVEKKKFGQQILGHKQLLVQTNLNKKKFVKSNFGPKRFWLENILGQTNFGFTNVFGQQICLVNKNFRSKNIEVKKHLGLKKLGKNIG